MKQRSGSMSVFTMAHTASRLPACTYNVTLSPTTRRASPNTRLFWHHSSIRLGVAAAVERCCCRSRDIGTRALLLAAEKEHSSCWRIVRCPAPRVSFHMGSPPGQATPRKPHHTERLWQPAGGCHGPQAVTQTVKGRGLGTRSLGWLVDFRAQIPCCSEPPRMAVKMGGWVCKISNVQDI